MGSILPVHLVPSFAEGGDDVLDANKENQNDENEYDADDFVFCNKLDERQWMWCGFSTIQNCILLRLEGYPEPLFFSGIPELDREQQNKQYDG